MFVRMSHNSVLSSQIGMVEFIGILNVKVIGGTNFAVRDMYSSDPYVVLTLGQQVIAFLISPTNNNTKQRALIG